MTAARAVDVLARFAAQAVEREGRRIFPVAVARRVVAASTEGQLAVRRLLAWSSAHAAREIVVPDVRGAGTWTDVVFRANAAAVAAIDRVTGAELVEVELADRSGFYQSRGHVPLAERGVDELEWCLRTLDASLAAAAMHGVELPGEAVAQLDAFRAELARRAAR